MEGATTLERREFCAYNINIHQKKKISIWVKKSRHVLSFEWFFVIAVSKLTAPSWNWPAILVLSSKGMWVVWAGEGAAYVTSHDKFSF